MFWNKIAPVYDFFEEIYNKKVYLNTGKTVAAYIKKTDDVLECARYFRCFFHGTVCSKRQDQKYDRDDRHSDSCRCKP